MHVKISMLVVAISAGAAAADDITALYGKDYRQANLPQCVLSDSRTIGLWNHHRQTVKVLIKQPGGTLWWSVLPDGIPRGRGDEASLCPGTYDVKVVGMSSNKTLFVATGMMLSGMKSFEVTPKGTLVPRRIITDKRSPKDSGKNRIVVHNHMLCGIGDGVRFVATFKDGHTVEGLDAVDLAIDKKHMLPARVVAMNAATKAVIATTTITALGADVVLDDNCQFEH